MLCSLALGVIVTLSHLLSHRLAEWIFEHQVPDVTFSCCSDSDPNCMP